MSKFNISSHSFEYKYLEIYIWKNIFKICYDKRRSTRLDTLIKLFSASLFFIFMVQLLIWAGRSVFFFYNLLSEKTFEIDFLFVAYYRACLIDLQWSFLPHCPTFTDSVLKRSEAFFMLRLTLSMWTKNSFEGNLLVSTSYERELIVLFFFSHKPHKSWSYCHQYHYFRPVVYKSENQVDKSVVPNIETI